MSPLAYVSKDTPHTACHEVFRDPRRHDLGFLNFLRSRPCCICGLPAEAAHIRIGLTGMQTKPHDSRAVPLCVRHHREGPEAQHSMNEAVFWDKHRIDPFQLAARYYAEYGGDGGKSKGPRKIKARKPRKDRGKVKSRGFTKQPKRAWPKRSMRTKLHAD